MKALFLLFFETQRKPVGKHRVMNGIICYHCLINGTFLVIDM